MLRVQPFQGLRPTDDLVPLVASAPFDAVTSQEAADLVADNPYSILHVDHAEVDLPAGTAAASPEAIEQARQTLQTFQEHEILLTENQPCVSIHQQRVGEATQIGIVLTCRLEDYERGIIRNRTDRENLDEARMLEGLGAQTSPVMLTYPDSPDLEALIAEVVKMPPLSDFTTPDGVAHTLWRLPGLALGEFFVQAFAQVPSATVFAGHSLAAGALRVWKRRREQNPDHTGEEPYNWLLCTLFPEGQLAAFEPKRYAGLFVREI